MCEAARPLISVVMAVYNGEAYLTEAIESLLRQTMPNFELVAVDDGSTDGSLRILNELQTLDSRIRVIRNETNIGLAASLNRGIAASNAEIIARADADDVYHLERLQRQMDAMVANPDLTIVGSAVSFIDEDGHPQTIRPDPTFPTTCRQIRLHSLLGCCLWHTTVMFRKKAIQSVGGYSTDFRGGPEDYDLWSRLSPDHRFINLPEVLAHVRIHQASVTANWNIGFEMFCQVSQRMIERYLKRNVSTESSQAAVALGSYGGDLTKMMVPEGLSLLMDVLRTARTREQRDDFRKFRRRCSNSIVEKSTAYLYKHRRLSVTLLVGALRVNPETLLSRIFWAKLVRVTCPPAIMQVLRNCKRPAFPAKQTKGITQQ
jgi:hypothetical protein